MGTAIKHPVPDQTGLGRRLSCMTFGHSDSPERQSARMSKITNDCLTRSGTGCFIAVPIWQLNNGRQMVNCSRQPPKKRLVHAK